MSGEPIEGVVPQFGSDNRNENRFANGLGIESKVTRRSLQGVAEVIS